MHGMALWVRTGLLILIPLGIGLVIAWDRSGEERRNSEAAARRYARAYDQIEFRMPSTQVDELLGPRGEWAEGARWPRHVGQVPGFENGCKIVRQIMSSPTAEGPILHLPPESPVRWKIWSVPGDLQWIAVGFVREDSGWAIVRPVVLTKRCGRDSEPPGR